MDVEKTIEFLLAHQARMAAENEGFHAHQAAVRADHEERFKLLEVSQLEFDERLNRLAKFVEDSYRYLDQADKVSREDLLRYKAEQRELHKHMDERLNAMIQIVDEIIRKRPQQ